MVKTFFTVSLLQKVKAIWFCTCSKTLRNMQMLRLHLQTIARQILRITCQKIHFTQSKAKNWHELNTSCQPLCTIHWNNCHRRACVSMSQSAVRARSPKQIGTTQQLLGPLPSINALPLQFVLSLFRSLFRDSDTTQKDKASYPLLVSS